MKLPEKTIERLSEYRRTLYNCLANGKTHIYSHELANLHSNTAVQVRRDLMLIGFSSLTKKGYDVKELIDLISKILDNKDGQNVAVIGMGNLGKAITAYFNGKRSKLNIKATFDIDPEKIGHPQSGVMCHDIAHFNDIVKREGITIAVVTASPNSAQGLVDLIEKAGIKGVLNFTSTPINFSENIYHEEYDMITSLEKVAYFVKERSAKRKSL
jgi:AT-rich DNA-binding protein